LAAAALAAASAEAAAAEKMRTERIATAEADAAVRATQERLARQEAEEKVRKAKEEELMQLQMAEEASAAESVRMAEEEAAREAERLAAASEEPEGPTDVELAEGETLEGLKARMGNLKPKKQAIPADLLNNANSYDDKVALIRMIVADNSGRVAGVMRGMIES
jgi:flagellar M-ring protein FliF